MSKLVVALLLAASAAPLEAQNAAARGQLVGRVLDAETGEGLPGVRIALLPASIPPPPGPLPQGDTNADGVYTIGNVPPGRYRISAQRADFAPSGAPGAALVIEVTSGTINASDIRLQRGGTIAGRVLDDKGRPLPGVMVNAVQPSKAAGLFSELSVGQGGRTDDRGEYRLSAVPAGTYFVLARPAPLPPFAASGQRTPALAATYYPGAPDVASAVPITVTKGSTTYVIDFQMLTSETFQVSGIVVDEQGRRLSGAVVMILQVGGPVSFPTTVTTQANGSFAVALPAGRYQLAAAVPVVTTGGGNGVVSSSLNARTTTRGGFGTEVVIQGQPVDGVRIVVRADAPSR